MTNDRKEFVLAALRCTCLRVRLIDNELQTIGVALKGDLISPDLALEWAEETAPGCVGISLESLPSEKRVA